MRWVHEAARQPSRRLGAACTPRRDDASCCRAFRSRATPICCRSRDRGDCATRRVTGGLAYGRQLAGRRLLLLTEDGYAFSQVERYLRAACAAGGASARGAGGAAAATGGRRVAPTAAGGGASRLAPTRAGRVDAQMTAVIETLAAAGLRRRLRLRRPRRSALLDRSRAAAVARRVRPTCRRESSPLPVDWSTLRRRWPHRPARQPARRAACSRCPAASSRTWPKSARQRLAATRQSPPPASRRRSGCRPRRRPPGGYCLELEARADASRRAPPRRSPAPPVWITSPPLAVPPGHACRDHGLGARRRDADRLGRPAADLRLDRRRGVGACGSRRRRSWTPFRLVRAAPPGAECRVTIALGGVGRAQVDSLRVPAHSAAERCHAAASR